VIYGDELRGEKGMECKMEMREHEGDGIAGGEGRMKKTLIKW